MSHWSGSARRCGLGLVAGAVLLALGAAGLAAQPTRPTPTQPTPKPPVPADTVRPKQQPGDTLRRPAQPDTVRVKRDTVTIGAPAASDSARRARIDSVKGIPDSLKKKVRADSIQAPLAHSEAPPAIGVGPLYRWTRDSVLSTGAVNLADLLDRVPGLTVYRSGFLASAQTAAYLGDFTKVRVFRDGIELDPLDPRTGGVRDVGDIQLANIDEILVERAAGEIRVHVRTWTVRNTTPYTRVDAFTGDEDTNLYRFFYGRRFGSGFDAQVGVEQFGTGSRNRRVGGGGTVFDALGRVGWSRKKASVDLVFTRLDRRRDPTRTFFEQDSVLPREQNRRSEAYARIGYGDPDSTGPWIQAIANTLSSSLAGTGFTQLDTTRTYTGSSKKLTRIVPAIERVDTVRVADSAFARVQYLLTGGFTRGAYRISGAERVRAFLGTTHQTPSVRVSIDRPRFAVSALGEWNAVGGLLTEADSVWTTHKGQRVVVDTTATSPLKTDTTRRDTLVVSRRYASFVNRPTLTTRFDVSGRFLPLSWLALLGAVSREQRQLYQAAAQNDTPSTIGYTKVQYPGVLTTRLEAAIRYHRLWLSGGLIRRGADTLMAPRVYECLASPTNGACLRPEGEKDSSAAARGATGVIVGARGPVYKDVYLDITGTGYKRSDAAYRPQYQLRGEIGVQTNWLTRFPSGNFGFKTALIDEYRSGVRFPTAFDSIQGAGLPFCDLQPCAGPSNVLTFQLEIRIQTGTLSYRFSNGLNRAYETVPGMRMPGPVSYYGVRWTFWN